MMYIEEGRERIGKVMAMSFGYNKLACLKYLFFTGRNFYGEEKLRIQKARNRTRRTVAMERVAWTAV
tara:strand:- start:317 stop:517 length:201 start_codon:yes stop_codon:yes gene_type:complete